MKTFTFTLTSNSSSTSPSWRVQSSTPEEAWLALSKVKNLPVERLKTFMTLNIKQDDVIEQSI